MSESDATHRAGFVAILGPPNAGKSTLMNRMLGEKLAIVTAKPQTTRSRILGIHSLEGAQILFVDTPGLHESTKRLNAVLNESVDDALVNCDMAILLVDLSQGWDPAHQRLFQALRDRGRELVIVGTKCDLVSENAPLVPAVGAEGRPEAVDEAPCIRISARTGEGVKELEAMIVERLPVSPPLYPEDALTDRSMRWLAGELVRESVFEELDQELPYSIAVEVVKYDESRSDIISIHANILVQRNSQKRIVVGKGGEMIKRIGMRARPPIEKLVGARVNLQLFVKVDPKWLKNDKRIEGLGYT